MLPVAFLFFLVPCCWSTTASAQPVWPSANSWKHWHGWPSVRHFIIFGDSYTTVGFNASTGPQPSIEDPIGNPAYPGHTSANGPNWVDFMTTTYNESLILTYDLGYGGATIDADIIPGTGPTITLKNQVYDYYLPVYINDQGPVPWSPDDSLFAFFFGINDVGNSYLDSDASKEVEAAWTEYAAFVDVVYQTGARNFLFLNVPPVDRSPLTKSAGPKDQAVEKAGITAWNQQLASIAQNLTSEYHDVTAFVFDTNEVFTAILDDPTTYTQTSALKNVTDYCPPYENGTATTDSFIPGCLYPVDQYFWLNTLHPTYPVHNATASQIVKQLGGSGYVHRGPWGWCEDGPHAVPGTWTPWGVQYPPSR